MRRNKIKSKWIQNIILCVMIFFLTFLLRTQIIDAAENEHKCTIAIPVSVELKGNAESIMPEVFQYRLEEQNVNTPTEAMLSKITVNKAEITTGSFDKISYTKPGDYEYRVYQLKGNNKNIVYDDSVYEVTVRVINTKDGSLTAEVWAVKDESEQKVDEIKFINNHKENVQVATREKKETIHHTTNTITKSSIGTSSAKTGDNSSLFCWGVIAILSSICICFFIFAGKRRKL